MEYFLVFFLVAVVLSPLAWLKSSPGQKRVAGFRSRALVQGLQVQLVPEIDAEDSVKRPDAVRYFLAYPPNRALELRGEIGTWSLLRNSRRGWPSPWPEWNWYRGEAPAAGQARIGVVVADLPEVAYGIKAESGGVAVFLRESGGVEVVDRIAANLKLLLNH